MACAGDNFQIKYTHDAPTGVGHQKQQQNRDLTLIQGLHGDKMRKGVADKKQVAYFSVRVIISRVADKLRSQSM